jgi:hypothetical protein
MTRLCEIIMECPTIKGVDKLVLYGWAAQLVEGNDTACASKTTVGDFIGVSDDTVLRHTKALVASGLMIATGNRAQWEFGWTPVYTINVPRILELCEAQPRKMRGVANCTPPQHAAQGSNALRFTGSRFIGLSDATTTTAFCGGGKSASTGLRPVAATPSKTVVRVEDRENREPKTLEPTAKPIALPTPEADAHGQDPNSGTHSGTYGGTHGGQVGKSGKPNGRVCKDCGQPLLRNVNHFLNCTVAKGRSDMDEYLGDMLPRPTPLEEIEFDNRDWGLSPFEILGKAAQASKSGGSAVSQSNGSEASEGKNNSQPLAQSPYSAAPLCCFCAKAPARSSTSDYCKDCWDDRQRTGIIPKFMGETRPTGISS